MVCNGPCRSCGGVAVQRLQIQLFLARAAAASLGSPEQERWNAVLQLLKVRGRCCACSSQSIGVLGGSALAVVSERSAGQRLFPRGGLVGGAVDTTTFPGVRRGRCISSQSGLGVDKGVAHVRGLIPARNDCWHRWLMWLVLYEAGHDLVSCDRWKPLQRRCLCGPFLQELACHCR